MNKGSIVERLCSDLDRKEPRYKSPTFTLLNLIATIGLGKFFNGYIPEMTSFAGRMNEKWGLRLQPLVCAAAITCTQLIIRLAVFSEGHGAGGEWATLNETRDFWIQTEVPDL